MAVNYIAAKNIYPGFGGETVGNIATGGIGKTSEDITSLDQDVEQALSIGGSASPLMGMFAFGVLIVGLMLLARHLGEEKEFSNLKLSFYNIVMTSLVAVAGIPLWKYIFTKVKVPGVSTWVLSV